MSFLRNRRTRTRFIAFNRTLQVVSIVTLYKNTLILLTNPFVIIHRKFAFFYILEYKYILNIDKIILVIQFFLQHINNTHRFNCFAYNRRMGNNVKHIIIIMYRKTARRTTPLVYWRNIYMYISSKLLNICTKLTFIYLPITSFHLLFQNTYKIPTFGNQ